VTKEFKTPWRDSREAPSASITICCSVCRSVSDPVQRSLQSMTRPAGIASVPNHNPRPHHLQSSLIGGGVDPGSLTLTLKIPPSARSSSRGSSRLTSPAPSPRYLQATAASAAKSVAPAPAPNADSSPLEHAAPAFETQLDAVDVSDHTTQADALLPTDGMTSLPALSTLPRVGEPAGGDANDAMKTQIDFDQEHPRRPLRRETNVARRNVPATTASIASPVRGATLQSPRGVASQRLWEAGMFAEAGPGRPREEPAGGAYPGAVVPPRAPPHRATGGACTHDKSLPNPRRSQRGAGIFQPGPAVTTTAALATSSVELTTDAGFASLPIKRRGRGVASPRVPRPHTSNPNDAGDATDDSTDGGEKLLGARRAKGVYSRWLQTSEALLAWDA
jgi:hypothetical protein